MLPSDPHAAGLPDIPVMQHNRGRDVTDCILGVTGRGTIGASEQATGYADLAQFTPPPPPRP